MAQSAVVPRSSKEAPIVRRVESNFGPFTRHPKLQEAVKIALENRADPTPRRAKQVQGYNMVVGIVLQCKQEASYRKVTICPIKIPAEQQNMPAAIGKLDEAGNLCLVERYVTPRAPKDKAKPEDWVPADRADWKYSKIKPFHRFIINDFESTIANIAPFSLVKVFDLTTHAFHPKKDGIEDFDNVAYTLRGLLRVCTQLPAGLTPYDVISHLPLQMRETPNALEMLARKELARMNGDEITIYNQSYITQIQTSDKKLMQAFTAENDEDFSFTYTRRPETNLTVKVAGKANQDIYVPVLSFTGIAVNHVRGRSFCADINLQMRSDLIYKQFGVQTGKVWETIYPNIEVDGWQVDASIKVSDTEYPENALAVQRICGVYSTVQDFDYFNDPIDIIHGTPDVTDEDMDMADPSACETLLKSMCAFKAEGYVNQLFLPHRDFIWNHSIPVTAEFLKRNNKWIQPVVELSKFEPKWMIGSPIVCLSECENPNEKINSDASNASRIRVMLPVPMMDELKILSKITPAEGDEVVAAICGPRGVSKIPPSLVSKGIHESLAGQTVPFFAAFVVPLPTKMANEEYDFTRFLETGIIEPINRNPKRSIEHLPDAEQKQARTDQVEDIDDDLLDTAF